MFSYFREIVKGGIFCRFVQQMAAIDSALIFRESNVEDREKLGPCCNNFEWWSEIEFQFLDADRKLAFVSQIAAPEYYLFIDFVLFSNSSLWSTARAFVWKAFWQSLCVLRELKNLYCNLCNKVHLGSNVQQLCDTVVTIFSRGLWQKLIWRAMTKRFRNKWEFVASFIYHCIILFIKPNLY